MQKTDTTFETEEILGLNLSLVEIIILSSRQVGVYVYKLEILLYIETNPKACGNYKLTYKQILLNPLTTTRRYTVA